ncbi:MAG: four helix bundle protein [Bacteroidales bacterium]|nr:four helix bundle protein [Bacteroidales bacterium]
MADALKNRGNILHQKSLAFAYRCVNLYKYLVYERPDKEYVMSRQLLKSGTSIGANIRESKNAQSPADFISKLSIALKEADESQYWIDLLRFGNFLSDREFESLNNDVKELIALLTSIIKTEKIKQINQPN